MENKEKKVNQAKELHQSGKIAEAQKIYLDLLKEQEKTKVQIKITNTSKNYTFELKNPRKFNFKTFTAIKDKEFIKKISF